MSNAQLPLSAEQKEALAENVAKLCSACVRISGLLGQKQQRGYLDIEAGFELFTTASTLCLGVAQARESTAEGALNWLNWHLERINAIRAFAGVDVLPSYTCLKMQPAVGAAFKKPSRVLLNESQIAKFCRAVNFLHSEALDLAVWFGGSARDGSIQNQLLSFHARLRQEPKVEQMTEQEALAWLNPLLGEAANLRLALDPTGTTHLPYNKL